eukprot:3418093-Rhodomonas_salina.1
MSRTARASGLCKRRLCRLRCPAMLALTCCLVRGAARCRDFANAAATGNGLDFYNPGVLDRNIHVQFPQGYSPRSGAAASRAASRAVLRVPLGADSTDHARSTQCHVVMNTDSVPSYTNNAWLSSAWARIGAVGANQ